jgi:hypothetical protein
LVVPVIAGLDRASLAVTAIERNHAAGPANASDATGCARAAGAASTTDAASATAATA